MGPNSSDNVFLHPFTYSSFSPAEECKRKWKNLRDRYLKEVRNELKTKQQGEFIPSRWKYRQLLNFIAPFTGSRNGVAENGNNDDDDDNGNHEAGDGEGETSDAARVALANTKASAGQVDSKAQVALVTQMSPSSPATQMAQLAFLTKLPSGTQIAPLTKPGKKRRLLSMPAPAPKIKRQVKDVVPCFSARQRDEDEMFLLSFVPALKRLNPQKRCETKIKIQQVMYEAEFSVEQPKSLEKPTEMESGTEIKQD